MKTLILGAGIGGLCSAIALKQKGFDVTVLERNKKPATIGAGLVCWPNASFILDKLGVLHKIEQVSAKLSYMHRISEHAEPLGSLNIEVINREMHYPSYAITRVDLQSILIERTKALEIEIIFDQNIIKLFDDDTEKNGMSPDEYPDNTDQSNSVQVVIENSENRRAELIIAADGRMNSIARQYLLGNNTPVYQGFINWIGIYRGNENLFPELSVSDYWGVGKRFGIVPLSHNQAYWAAGIAASHVDNQPIKSFKKEIKSHFNDWPDPIAKIIHETSETTLNKIYVHDHDPIACWHKKNMIMIGDAAHAALPTSGQGACLAMEDAWLLAEQLDSGDPLEKVFQQFTDARQDKTNGITYAARHFADSLFNTDESKCRHRNMRSIETDYESVAKSMAAAWSAGLPLSV